MIPMVDGGPSFPTRRVGLRLLTIGLLCGWLAWSPKVRAGGPAWVVPGGVSGKIAEKPFGYEVTPDGALFEGRVDGSPLVVWGAHLPGEEWQVGQPTRGLLSPADQRAVSRWFPAWLHGPDQPGGSLFPAGSNDVGSDFVVVLDPGHGGRDLGAVGVSGAREKDVVWKVTACILRQLEQVPGIQVVLTRQGDERVGLWERVELANQVRADLFISVHANAFIRPTLRGVETFFHSIEASDAEAHRVAAAENAPEQAIVLGPDAVMNILNDMQQAESLRDSSRFAHLVQAELAGSLPFENLGVKQADFVVLRGTRMPAVLLELGFMSNRVDEQLLKQPRTHQRIARAVKKSVLSFWELMRRKAGEAPFTVGVEQ